MIVRLLGLGAFFVAYCIIGYAGITLAQSLAEDIMNQQEDMHDDE